MVLIPGRLRGVPEGKKGVSGANWRLIVPSPLGRRFRYPVLSSSNSACFADLQLWSQGEFTVYKKGRLDRWNSVIPGSNLYSSATYW